MASNFNDNEPVWDFVDFRSRGNEVILFINLHTYSFKQHSLSTRTEVHPPLHRRHAADPS